MKKLFPFFFILLICFQVNAQELPVDPGTKKITYWEVVEVEGASAADLFKRAKNFGTVDKENILTDDAANGVYSTKSKISVAYPSPMKGLNHNGVVEYKLTVYCKEGRYKYVFSDFEHKSAKGDGGALEKGTPECGKYVLIPNGWATIKNLTAKEAPKLVEALKGGMKNPAKNSVKSNDW